MSKRTLLTPEQNVQLQRAAEAAGMHESLPRLDACSHTFSESIRKTRKRFPHPTLQLKADIDLLASLDDTPGNRETLAHWIDWVAQLAPVSSYEMLRDVLASVLDKSLQ